MDAACWEGTPLALFRIRDCSEKRYEGTPVAETPASTHPYTCCVMRRTLLIFVALLLPLQFAWSAASVYCQHETTEQQSKHFGHHFHAHKGEAQKSSDNKLLADSDCAWCQASGAAAIPTTLGGTASAATSVSTEAVITPPFTSALTRPPDRPQWLRLV